VAALRNLEPQARNLAHDIQSRSMTSTRHLSSILRDLQQIGSSFPRSQAALAAQGRVILEGFMKLAPFDSGAVYLRE